MNNLIVDEKKKSTFGIVPESFDGALKMADLISKSSFCPKEYIGQPGDILIAMQMGAEVGLKPMQALQNIAVINGRPSIWGDAMLALVQSHKDFEYIQEENPTGKEAICVIKRKGGPEHIVRFSMDDAVKAGLLSKKSMTWEKYPKRMLQMRARAFACRDVFADALKGLNCAEEVMDYHHIEKDITPVKKSEKLQNIIDSIDSSDQKQIENKSPDEILINIKESRNKTELVSLLPSLTELPEDFKIKARELYGDKMRSFAQEEEQENN